MTESRQSRVGSLSLFFYHLSGRLYGDVAHLVEHWFCNPEAAGSNPVFSTQGL